MTAAPKLPCEGCGGYVEGERLRTWVRARRARRLVVRAAHRLRRPGEGVSPNGLYLERSILEVTRLCPFCLERVRAGADVARLTGARRGRQMAAAAAAVLGVYLASPGVAGVLIVLHRGIIEAPPLRVLFDRTYKRFLDRDPTLERRSPGLKELYLGG